MARSIEDEYFEWLYDMMCRKKFSKSISYRKLLMYLYNTEFIFSIARDANRWEDGVNLRRRFGAHIEGPCSVLEMMVALSIRCEETIMDDAMIGDRTTQWFWGMITNLGLGGMYDSNYDRHYVESTVNAFLNRDYEPDGTGGLFTVRNTPDDLRRVDIWRQMCWYLNTIT